MKLLTYSVGGYVRWGAVVFGGVVDLATATGHTTLKSALAAGLLDTLANTLNGRQPDHDLADVVVLPVVPEPGKIVCIGTNYHDHRIETGREVPLHPVVFARFANSQVGHEQPILRPSQSHELDFEGEIAVVIGRRGRDIALTKAWEHVAGYAPYNDATLRDWQRHTHQWTPGKNFPGTGAFGPWMVTRDEIPDGTDLSLVTRLNGIEVQRSSAALMIFSIPDIIAYCSRFTELEPGDVLVTGTPGGVGGKRTPPLWMKPGDVVEVEVGQVGILRNTIAQA